MSRLMRIAFGVLGISGGAVGLGLVLWLLFQTGRLDPRLALLMSLSGAFFAFGIWCGVAALQQRPNWLNLTLVFWAPQVPFIMSSSFSYLLSAGVGAWVYVTSEQHIGASFYLGSLIKVGSGQVESGIVVGVNAFALVLLAIAGAAWRKRVPNPSIERTAKGLRPSSAAHVER